MKSWSESTFLLQRRYYLTDCKSIVSRTIAFYTVFVCCFYSTKQHELGQFFSTFSITCTPFSPPYSGMDNSSVHYFCCCLCLYICTLKSSHAGLYNKFRFMQIMISKVYSLCYCMTMWIGLYGINFSKFPSYNSRWLVLSLYLPIYSPRQWSRLGESLEKTPPLPLLNIFCFTQESVKCLDSPLVLFFKTIQYNFHPLQLPSINNKDFDWKLSINVTSCETIYGFFFSTMVDLSSRCTLL